MFVGPGRCGKDEAGNWLAAHTRLRFAGTTSKYLCKYVAAATGKSETECYLSRHDERVTWYEVGRRIRASDPAVLIRESLEHGDIVGGCRDREEVEAAREEGLVDLIVWVENARCEYDLTMRFGSDVADVVIENHWALTEYHQRLDRLARALGVRVLD